MPSIAKMVFGNGPLGPSYVVRTRTLARSHTDYILQLCPLDPSVSRCAKVLGTMVKSLQARGRLPTEGLPPR